MFEYDTYILYAHVAHRGYRKVRARGVGGSPVAHEFLTSLTTVRFLIRANVRSI